MGGSVRSIDALCVLTGHTDITACSVRLAADALCELRLAEMTSGGALRLLPAAGKTDLETSSVLQQARACFHSTD